MSHLGESRIGEYRFVRKLGGGGFGTVYLAEHIHEHSQVALKVLQMPLTKRDDFREFLNETRMMLRLRHPHIIPLLDVGLSPEDFPFLVMEYAPGGTLRDRHLKGSQVPLSSIASYVEQIASALQYAHDHRIIHRDVKPENMLLRTDGTLLLSDFGIAKIIEQSTLMSVQTQTGTPVYMAPEQHMGHPCTASDQYALAIMVYEWICGRRPFEGTLAGLAFQHMTALPPSLLNQIPTLPASLEQVVFKALSKKPEQRFGSVQEFAVALRTAIQQTSASEVEMKKNSFDEPSSKMVPIQQSPVPKQTKAQTSLAPHHTSEPSFPPLATTAPSNLEKAPKRFTLSRRNLLLGGGSLAGVLVLGLLWETGHLGPRPTLTVPSLNANTVSGLEEQWVFQTGGAVAASPTVNNGVAYIGSYDGNVYALDAQSGVKKWAFPTGNQVFSSPKVVDGVVYVGSYDKNVYALDAQSGVKKWAFPTGYWVDSSPAVVDGVVYVGSRDSNVYALDAQSGVKKWAFPTGNVVYSSPAVVDGVVYIVSVNNVYALDAQSGLKKWAFRIGESMSSSPAVVDGVIYVGSRDGNVYALDAQSGLKKWAFRTGDGVDSSPVVVDGVVYIGSYDKNVYALDAQSGLKKWAFRTGDSVFSSPAVVDGVVYIGSYDKNVYALDAQSGVKKWAFPTDDQVVSSPAVVDGVVYIGSCDKNVYAFGLLPTIS